MFDPLLFSDRGASGIKMKRREFIAGLGAAATPSFLCRLPRVRSNRRCR